MLLTLQVSRVDQTLQETRWSYVEVGISAGA